MTQRMPPKSRPTFVRLDEQERAEAQAAADALYDGNLSMFIRYAVRKATAAWRKGEKEAA